MSQSCFSFCTYCTFHLHNSHYRTLISFSCLTLAPSLSHTHLSLWHIHTETLTCLSTTHTSLFHVLIFAPVILFDRDAHTVSMATLKKKKGCLWLGRCLIGTMPEERSAAQASTFQPIQRAISVPELLKTLIKNELWGAVALWKSIWSQLNDFSPHFTDLLLNWGL